MYRSAKAVLAHPLGFFVVAVVAFAALWNVLLGTRPADVMSSGVVMWWTALCAVSLLNLCGWHVTALTLARRRVISSSP